MSGFKLIGFRIYDGFPKSISKNLKYNLLYQFYDWFDFQDKDKEPISGSSKKIIHNIQKKKVIANDFFSITKNDQKIKINISAIVGENGSGKSAIVDTLIKIIHTICYEYKGLGINTEISNCYFGLYYELGGVIFSIEYLKGKELKYYQYSEQGVRGEALGEMRVDLTKFFYSIYTNFSLYAWNESEGQNWLDSLFHKNDNYQVPIVLNPYRTDGVIDVNSEIYLGKSRLLTNMLTNGDKEFRITDKQFVSHIELILNQEKCNDFYTAEDLGEEQKITHKVIKTATQDYESLVFEKLFGKDVDVIKVKKSEFYDQGMNYLLNKLIGISRTYKKYLKYRPEFFKLKNDKTVDLNSFKLFGTYLEVLNKDESHITLKIRQTVQFLISNPLKDRAKDEGKMVHEEYQFTIPISEVKTLFKLKENDTNSINKIPPPFFKSDILLIEEGSNPKEINQFPRFSGLSSGEIQNILLNNGIFYHLSNLNSIINDTPQAGIFYYPNVNIVFDEVELYYHPDLQRRFISNLLRDLENAHLPRIKSINIMFITHSPFILSDIPSSNILRLKNGIPQTQSPKTFGANIHDLLSDSFFMKGGLIGSFSKSRINELINYLGDNRIALNSKKYDLTPKKAAEIIELIGEPILRNALLESLEIKKRLDVRKKNN